MTETMDSARTLARSLPAELAITRTFDGTRIEATRDGDHFRVTVAHDGLDLMSGTVGLGGLDARLEIGDASPWLRSRVGFVWALVVREVLANTVHVGRQGPREPAPAIGAEPQPDQITGEAFVVWADGSEERVQATVDCADLGSIKIGERRIGQYSRHLRPYLDRDEVQSFAPVPRGGLLARVAVWRGQNPGDAWDHD
jgi:hypothetical protein